MIKPWYDCEKEMKSLSSNFPSATFNIEAFGEEPEDIWYARVKNGKFVKKLAIILKPDFDY